MKIVHAYSRQEQLEFNIRFAIEKYDMGPTIEHRLKALKQIADAAENLRSWLEANPNLIEYGDSAQSLPQI